MKFIVCVDDRGGVLFNHRRVSSDRLVISNIMAYIGEAPLYVSEYSHKLFPDSEQLRLLTDLSAVEADAYVFLEDTLPECGLEQAGEVVVYHWNRLYPSDVQLPVSELRKRGSMHSVIEFKGNSHDKITREVYML